MMFVWKGQCKNEYYWNNQSALNWFFHAITLLLWCIMPSYSFYCSDHIDCGSCTKESYCMWDLALGNCIILSNKSEELNETNILFQSQCPEFTIIEHFAVTEKPYLYEIEISNCPILQYKLLNIVCNFREEKYRAMTHSFVYYNSNSYIYVIQCRMIFNYFSLTQYLTTPTHKVKINIEISTNNHTLLKIPDDYITVYDLEIKSMTLLDASWSDSANITFDVKNHRAIAEKCTEILVKTPKEWSCVDLKTIDNDTFTCSTMPISDADLSEPNQPTEIRYVLPRDVYTLTLEDKLNQFEPKITGFSPICGPTSGGTVLTITGNDLQTGNTFGVYIADENSIVKCNILSRNHNNFTCQTGPVVGGVAVRGPVVVEFDGLVPVMYMAEDTVPQFLYVAEPVVNGGQMIGGILAGGTTVHVRGHHFSCFDDYNATLFIVYNATRHYGRGCRVTNDTFMICQSPTLDNAPPSVTGTYLEFGFRTYFASNWSDLYLTPRKGYIAHPDPVYANFETTDDSVVIYSGAVEDHHSIGYWVEDVTVRLQNQKGIANVSDKEISCLVITASSHHIVCKSDFLPGSLDAVQTVEVTVGSFSCRVHRKPIQYSSELSTVCRVVIAISMLSLFAGIIFLCVFWLKTMKRYTLKTEPVVDYQPPSQCDTNLTAPKSDVVNIQDVMKSNDL